MKDDLNGITRVLVPKGIARYRADIHSACVAPMPERVFNVRQLHPEFQISTRLDPARQSLFAIQGRKN
jgi:hypothetical protein